MEDRESLRRRLWAMEGRAYPAYKEIVGRYDFGLFTLKIYHVQGDPFAAPSRMGLVFVPQKLNLPVWAYATPKRAVSTADWLTRQFGLALRRVSQRRPGTGKSGLLAVDVPGPEVLARSCCQVTASQVEMRFVVGLPAAGRRILGREAANLVCEQLPELAASSLVVSPEATAQLRTHVETVEDAQALRAQLAARHLVAFVGDGSILPRKSGVSSQPLQPPQGVAFTAPASLAQTLQRPHAGPIRGLGIPEGLTLIVGGGFHGKSTLLKALILGVYNHLPGDGREWVVTRPQAAAIRAEDGRRVCEVNIGGFIGALPGDRETDSFSSDNASGSTSQAANIVEAMELGADVLLMDEDTSATNFMIRDKRMQSLVAKEHEPITPYIDRVQEIYKRFGVSSILVLGGSGDYLDVADTVLAMENYQCRDVTHQARQVAAAFPTGRRIEVKTVFPTGVPRVPNPGSMDASRGGRTKVRARDTDEISFGTEEIDLSGLSQLVSLSQTRAIGMLLHWLAGHALDGHHSLREALELAYHVLDQHGLDVLSPENPVGDLALPRLLETGAALNRLRSLRLMHNFENRN
ncbi:ATPase [Alicyclobacillaceae bacterium I2511]|nr:ATPase [Alicyclobacillaceae bacterium I2511]